LESQINQKSLGTSKPKGPNRVAKINRTKQGRQNQKAQTGSPKSKGPHRFAKIKRPKHGRQNQKAQTGSPKSNGPNRIAKIDEGLLCLREIDLSFKNNYIV
jgi:hypothetical protein